MAQWGKELTTNLSDDELDAPSVIPRDLNERRDSRELSFDGHMWNHLSPDQSMLRQGAFPPVTSRGNKAELAELLFASEDFAPCDALSGRPQEGSGHNLSWHMAPLPLGALLASRSLSARKFPFCLGLLSDPASPSPSPPASVSVMSSQPSSCLQHLPCTNDAHTPQPSSRFD